MAIQIVCSECGSTDVVRDALAAWGLERQEWTLTTVLDDGFCNVCERKVSLSERTLLRLVSGGR